MSVPIAEAEQSDIHGIFNKVLCESWSLADNISGYPSLHFNELEYQRKSNSSADSKFVQDACFIYPEVSANVQGFVRSRVASEGIYLFSDIGAATVDHSTIAPLFSYANPMILNTLLTYMPRSCLSVQVK